MKNAGATGGSPKKETASSKSPRLEDHPGYSAAIALQDGLEALLAKAAANEETAILRANRQSKVMRYVASSIMFLPSMTSDELDGIVLSIIRDGKIAPGLVARLRADITAGLNTDDPDFDVDLVEGAQCAKAEKYLYARAVELQKREVLRQKNLAMQEISTVLQPERARKAREVVEALQALALALRGEYDFFSTLGLPEVPKALQPGPFPAPIPSTVAMIRWIAQARNISNAEAEAFIASAGPSAR